MVELAAVQKWLGVVMRTEVRTRAGIQKVQFDDT